MSLFCSHYKKIIDMKNMFFSAHATGVLASPNPRAMPLRAPGPVLEVSVLFNERGDVLAVVCGHDHANSYDIPCGNIRLICTPTCGFQAHGAEKTRGARIIDLDLRDTSRFETTTILYTDSAFADIINNFTYKFINFWKELYLIGNNLLVYAREILGI